MLLGYSDFSKLRYGWVLSSIVDYCYGIVRWVIGQSSVCDGEVWYIPVRGRCS